MQRLSVHTDYLESFLMGAPESKSCRPRVFKAGLTTELFSVDCSRKTVSFLERCWPPLPNGPGHHHLSSGICPASFLVPAPTRSPSISFSFLKPEQWYVLLTNLIVYLPFLKTFIGFFITLKMNTRLLLAQQAWSDPSSPIWPPLLLSLSWASFQPHWPSSLCGTSWAASPHRVLRSPFPHPSSTPTSVSLLVALLAPCPLPSVHQWPTWPMWHLG